MKGNLRNNVSDVINKQILLYPPKHHCSSIWCRIISIIRCRFHKSSWSTWVLFKGYSRNNLMSVITAAVLSYLNPSPTRPPQYYSGKKCLKMQGVEFSHSSLNAASVFEERGFSESCSRWASDTGMKESRGRDEVALRWAHTLSCR